MFKVIVAGGIALVSVGSLAALSSCGGSSTSTQDASDDGTFPHEGPIPPPQD